MIIVQDFGINIGDIVCLNLILFCFIYVKIKQKGQKNAKTFSKPMCKTQKLAQLLQISTDGITSLGTNRIRHFQTYKLTFKKKKYDEVDGD